MALSTLESSRIATPALGVSPLRTFRRFAASGDVEDWIECSGGTGLGIDAGALGCHCLEVVLRFPFGQSFALDLLSSA